MYIHNYICMYVHVIHTWLPYFFSLMQKQNVFIYFNSQPPANLIFWSFGNKFSFTGPTTTYILIWLQPTLCTCTYNTYSVLYLLYILCRKTLGFKNAVFSASTKTVASFAFDLLVQKERTNSTNWGPEHLDNRPVWLATLSKVLLKQNQAYSGVIRMYGVCIICRTRNGKSGCSLFSSQLVTS